MENLREQFQSEIENKNPGNSMEILFQSNLQAYADWLEKKIKKYKSKADKWDKLDEEIGRFYDSDCEELNGSDSEEGDLCDIGEVAAKAFGYL